jgi:hypothetical protein
VLSQCAGHELRLNLQGRKPSAQFEQLVAYALQDWLFMLGNHFPGLQPGTVFATASKDAVLGLGSICKQYQAYTSFCSPGLGMQSAAAAAAAAAAAEQVAQPAPTANC